MLRAEGGALAPADLARAAEALRSGTLVAFPTDTVYGVGTNAADAVAIRRLFEAKGRPRDKALPVLIADAEDLPICAQEVPAAALALAEAFWPGPLTMVLRRTDAVCPEVAAGGDTVAVRLPSHDLARALLREAGVPVAVTSANLSGDRGTVDVAEVLRDLGAWVEVVVAEPPTGTGVPSTVVDLTVTPPTVLRWGAVTRENLTHLIGDVDGPTE